MHASGAGRSGATWPGRTNDSHADGFKARPIWGPGLVMAWQISIRLERVGSRPLKGGSIAAVGAVVRSGWLVVRRWRALGWANRTVGTHALSTHEARTAGPRSPGQSRYGAARESLCDLRSGAIANMPG